jgi:hypothetical protein
MSKNNIPVVIIHRTYKDYLKINLEITGRNNKIYLIGDSSIEHLGLIDNVIFVNINKYENLPLIKEKYNSFINYSSNSKNFEWLCFERVFIINYFMQEFKLNQVFHIDSDNILLDDINNYPFQKSIAYCLNKNYHKYRMSYSIHCGLLNEEFTKNFIDLYDDLYVNKSKFHLIEDKIKYHTKNGVFEGGGICDMTLYYLLENEKMIDVQNLLLPINNRLFINNINSGEGCESKNQFMINNFNLINIEYIDDKYVVHNTLNNKKEQILNIHFQGAAKRFMQNFSLVYNKK